MTALLLIARLVLALLFLLAGVAKLRDRPGSRAAMIGIGLPTFLATSFAVWLPVMELITAVALLPARSATLGGWAALVMLGGFTLGIASVLMRGVEADCHCFGQLHSGPMGWATLARTAALALIATFIIVGQQASGSPSYLDWIGGFTAMETLALAAALLALSLLVAGTWFGMHLMRQQGRILLRLDALETELRERELLLARGATGVLPEGPPAGQPAPAFEAPNLEGGSSSLRDLLAPGLPLVLIFIRPNCLPCTELLPEIARWQGVLGGRLTLGLVSQGDIEVNRRKFVKAGIRRVLIERELEITRAFAIHTTPSALVISPDGTVASETALGAEAIRHLVGAIAPRPASGVRLPATPTVSLDAG